MTSQKILVVGSAAYDLLLQYDGSFVDALQEQDLEKLSAAFVTPHFAKHHGGTGANIAWNLALLSGSPLLVTTVGSDGAEYKRFLAEHGVEDSYIEELHEHFTATAILGTDSSERQIIFFHPGADAHGTFPDLSQSVEEIAYAIVSPRSALLMQEALAWCKQNGIRVFFDPGQQLGAFSNDELLRGIQGSEGVFANAYEWSVLSSRLNLSEKEILEHTHMLIVTRGEDGVTVHTEDGIYEIPACKASQVVNPTGAGDAFRAGFLSGLTAEWSLEDATRLGAALASFVVEKEGTLLDQLDLDELRERARQAYSSELPTLS